MKRIISSIICLALIIVLLPQTVSAVGLGISPSVFEINNLVRGIHVERQIMLSRSDATEELTFKVVGEGQISEWLSVEQGENFTIPSGVHRFSVNIRIDVPDDAPNGIHKGNLRFLSQQSNNIEGDDNASTQISTNVNAVLQLALTISGDQLLDYSITSLDIPPLEEGWPMQIVLNIQNNGNVAAIPDRIEVEIWDKYKEAKVKSFELTDFSKSNSVKAFSQGDFITSYDKLDLDIDQYWAVVRSYLKEDILFEESVIFDVFPVGTIDQLAELKEVTISSELPEKGEIIKIGAEIANIETSSLVGNLVVEVKRAGHLEEILKGSILTIRPNQSEVSNLFYTPNKNGSYTLDVYFEYSGRQTQTVVKKFAVDSSLVLSKFMIIFISLIIIMIVALITYLIKSTKKKKLSSSLDSEKTKTASKKKRK